jgi:hypothetical protein
MKYSATTAILVGILAIAIIWWVTASARANVNKGATAKCAIENTRAGCQECCDRERLPNSFSALGNECKCLNSP